MHLLYGDLFAPYKFNNQSINQAYLQQIIVNYMHFENITLQHFHATRLIGSLLPETKGNRLIQVFLCYITSMLTCLLH
jgi:hypothetical protein